MQLLSNLERDWTRITFFGPRKKIAKIVSKLQTFLFNCGKMAKRIDPRFPLWKWGTPRKSNAPSTISLAHTKHTIYASKVVSRTQNSQIEKSWFFKFLAKPIEYSIQRESSHRLYHYSISRSEAMGYALSNALSTIVIRHVQRAVSGFKVAHKNRKSRKSKFRSYGIA